MSMTPDPAAQVAAKVTLRLSVRHARFVQVILGEMADVTHDDSVRQDCRQLARTIGKAIRAVTT